LNGIKKIRGGGSGLKLANILIIIKNNINNFELYL